MSVANFMRNHVISFLLGNVCPKVIFQKYLVDFGKFSSSSRKLLFFHRRHISLSRGISKPLSEIRYEINDGGDHLPENKYVKMRTHSCGSLNVKDVGTSVRLCGWLQFSRMGRFLLLRDSYGVTQVLISDKRKDLKEKLNNLHFESVVAVTGEVTLRPAGQERTDISTGRIEVLAHDVTVLNLAKKDIPFFIRDYNKAKETLQMKHRYLSLRFAELQHNLRLRSHFVNAMREFLIKKCAFVEVETPTLFRRTPGGAQEFIVPTQRPGHFYSLVQSPQQLKQMLMVGAIDRYFQVARCYRDETARPDRQPEFTQMDIEMSFASRCDIMGLIEGLLENCWHTCVGNSNMAPFPRITYDEAMASYGSDKPDTRFEMKLVDVTQLIQNNSSNIELQKLLTSHPSFVAVSFVVPKSLDQGNLSKNSLKKVEEILKKSLGKLSSFRLMYEKVSLGKGADFNAFYEHLCIGHDDWIVTAVGGKNEVLTFLGRMRLKVADLLESKGVQVRSEGFNFLWVEDFPLFLPAESNSEEVILESAHHPFTQPHPDDLHLLHTQPLKVRGLHYDLVCNGCEIGGGSVRVHDAVLQCAILDILGIDKKSLSHLLEALECGCPPHAGIALGIDRMMALAVGADSVREVIAFPKGSDGQDIMSGSPSLIHEEELDLYHISVKKVDSSSEKK